MQGYQNLYKLSHYLIIINYTDFFSDKIIASFIFFQDKNYSKIIREDVTFCTPKGIFTTVALIDKKSSRSVYFSGLKPLESSPCIIQECVEQFEYRVVGMTPCSRSCLGGEWFPCKPQREAQTQHKIALRHNVRALVSFICHQIKTRLYKTLILCSFLLSAIFPKNCN